MRHVLKQTNSMLNSLWFGATMWRHRVGVNIGSDNGLLPDATKNQWKISLKCSRSQWVNSLSCVDMYIQPGHGYLFPWQFRSVVFGVPTQLPHDVLEANQGLLQTKIVSFNIQNALLWRSLHSCWYHWIGHVVWSMNCWPGTLSLQSGQCYSIEDCVSVDFISLHLIFKWVSVAW